MISNIFSYPSKGEHMQNIKGNIILIISALSFYMLSTPEKSRKYIIGLFMAFIALVITGAMFKKNQQSQTTENNYIRIFSAIGTIGIAENGVERFIQNLKNSNFLHNILGDNLIIFLITFSVLFALFSIPFLYTSLCLFYQKIIVRFLPIKNKIAALPKAEICFYAVILFVFFVYMTAVFNQSYAFYSPERELEDLIYTTDTRLIAQPNAYLTLTNNENDLRQPLFAVFSAPFIAAPYALSLPFRIFAPYASLYFMNYAQIVLLIVTIILLSLLSSDKPLTRVFFALFLCSSFPYLLFSLVMEQYIIATFFLILFIYSTCMQKQKDTLLLFCAIGTLSTSAILTPLVIESNPIKEPKKWIKRIFFLGLSFVFIMILFFRGDIFVCIFSKIRTYLTYTGKSIPLIQRCMQYVSFVSSCFFAPASEIRFINIDSSFCSWQLSPITNWNITGLVILSLCTVSIAINHKNLLCKIAAIWIVFSILLLCFLGWGCAENGQVLYTLYFSWSFAVLLFMLLSNIANIIPNFEKASCIILAILFLKCNIPMLKLLFSFVREICPR